MSTSVLRGTLVLPDGLVSDGLVVLNAGRIAEVTAGESGRTATHDYGRAYIVPGLIDSHVHGIAGADLMDGSVDSLHRMARAFAAHGVTGFLPTTVTQDLARTQRAITVAREFMSAPPAGGARALGIHLEGPFINPAFNGMQPRDFILSPDLDITRDLLRQGNGAVVRMSLAPELPGADELIGLLLEQGVRVSVAHTGATYDQVLHAVQLGATHVTHCFNAMTPLHHREPGAAGAALTCPQLYTELVADGVHVHPAVMRLTIRAKGRERVMVVTDSMSATDMPDGRYQFGGLEVTVRDRVARLASGRLASSTLTMEVGVRNLVEFCGVSLVDAVYMASTTPAGAIGLEHSHGIIAPGYVADLAVLDESLSPVATWVAGGLAWTVVDDGDASS